MVSSLGPKGALTSRGGGQSWGDHPAGWETGLGNSRDPVQPSKPGAPWQGLGASFQPCICGSSVFLHHVASLGTVVSGQKALSSRLSNLFGHCRGCPWVEEQSQPLRGSMRTSKKRVLRVTPVYRLALIWHLLYPWLLSMLVITLWLLLTLGTAPVSPFQVRSPRADWAHSPGLVRRTRSLWS